MIQNPLGGNDLAGMSADAAKEYLLGFVSTLKLIEKEISALQGEEAKWKDRAELARARQLPDLLTEAEKEAGRIHERLAALREEERSLRQDIDSIRRQLPGLAARQRSIDPDLLEQELLMALGGRSAEEIQTEKAFTAMEKENAADAALQELKAKMEK